MAAGAPDGAPFSDAWGRDRRHHLALDLTVMTVSSPKAPDAPARRVTCLSRVCDRAMRGSARGSQRQAHGRSQGTLVHRSRASRVLSHTLTTVPKALARVPAGCPGFFCRVRDAEGLAAQAASCRGGMASRLGWLHDAAVDDRSERAVMRRLLADTQEPVICARTRLQPLGGPVDVR